jgi:hypothetical protein
MLSGKWGCLFCYLADGGDLPDRLLVDLDTDGQARVATWPDGGLPEEVSRASLEWPVDADALVLQPHLVILQSLSLVVAAAGPFLVAVAPS